MIEANFIGSIVSRLAHDNIATFMNRGLTSTVTALVVVIVWALSQQSSLGR